MILMQPSSFWPLLLQFYQQCELWKHLRIWHMLRFHFTLTHYRHQHLKITRVSNSACWPFFMTIHHFISAVTSNTKFICNCWGLIWLVQRPTGFCPINITFVHSVMDKTSSPQWAKSKKGKINGSHTKQLWGTGWIR